MDTFVSIHVYIDDSYSLFCVLFEFMEVVCCCVYFILLVCSEVNNVISAKFLRFQFKTNGFMCRARYKWQGFIQKVLSGGIAVCKIRN